MHKGRREARAVACAMINCDDRSECEKKKDDPKELHGALTAPRVVQGIISSRSRVPRIYSKSNFDRGRENNCAKPREGGLE